MDDSIRAAPGAASTDLSAGQVFELLADERRRLAVACLADESGSASLASLAERVADAEAERASTPSSDTHSETVFTLLYHVDLPKLAAADVVDFDYDEKEIEPAANLASLAAVAENLTSRDEDDREPSPHVP